MAYTFNRRDVFDLAEAIGADTHQKGDELFFKYCPRCGGDGHDKDTFSVNLTTGAFKCFRASCDYHGHFVELARDVNYPLDFGEVKTFKRLPQKPITSSELAIRYLESRGIGRTVTERYKITTRKDNQDILAFPFYDENGVLQFIKYRNTKYKKGGQGSKEWCETDTKPILFGMAQCVNTDRLIITEGQIDSLTVAECGYDNAVSVPTGASGFTWLSHCWDWVSKFKSIVVFGDYENGKMSLIETLQNRLPQRVMGVRAQDYLGEKDANDILRKYGKAAIITAIESAEVPQITCVKDLSTVAIVDVNALPKIKTNIRELDKVIGGLIFGQVVLLTGKRGDGKSTFMSQLVAEALDQNQSVFVYSGELQDYHFRRWLDYQLAGADNIEAGTNEYGDTEYTMKTAVSETIGKWYKGRAFIYDNSYIPEKSTEIESLPKVIEKVVKQYGVTMICIDNLMTAMDVVTQNDNLNLAQSNFVTELKKIAMRYNVVIILVAHPRKGKSEDMNDDVSGSSDITNRVDVVLSYKREATDDGGTGGKLSVSKNRLKGIWAIGDDAINLLYSPKTKRIFGTKSVARKYGWEKSNYTDSLVEELPF